MELPKNITQIGESDRNCKIYVEDYVISYIKQVNQLALNKEMAVALYGVRKTEGNVMYLFIYGACKLDFLHRETRHLSQAQCQEIEKLRKKYFPNYEFQGYRLLNGEMVEGFHVYEQEICRYIAGYAQFYEKNDSMLAYMLDVRPEEASPEVVDQEKYEMVKRRQEERRTQYGEGGFRSAESYEKGVEPEARASETVMASEGTVRENRRGTGDRMDRAAREKKAVKARDASREKHSSSGLRGMRLATVAVFAVLCVAGVSTLGQGRSIEELQEAAQQAMSSLTEQKLPDAQEAGSQSAVTQNAQSSTLIAEDKLAEALQAENVGTGSSSNGQAAGVTHTEQGTAAEQQAGAAQTAQGTIADQRAGVAQTAQEAQGSTASQQTNATQAGQASQGSTTDQQASTTQTAQGSVGSQQSGTTQASQGSQQASTTQTTQGSAADQQADAAQTTQGTTGTQQADTSTSTQETAVTSGDTTTQDAATTEAAAQPTSYTIQQGDTLIGISIRNYGTDTMVSEICSLNQISNPDDIKVGQKILLP